MTTFPSRKKGLSFCWLLGACLTPAKVNNLFKHTKYYTHKKKQTKYGIEEIWESPYLPIAETSNPVTLIIDITGCNVNYKLRGFMDSLRYTDNSVTGQFPGEITDRDRIHQMGRSHKNTYNALKDSHTICLLQWSYRKWHVHTMFQLKKFKNKLKIKNKHENFLLRSGWLCSAAVSSLLLSVPTDRSMSWKMTVNGHIA